MPRPAEHGWTGPIVVGLAPLVLLVAFLSHPFLTGVPNPSSVAAAVESSPTRWGIAHLLTNVGSALLALAFLAVRAHLHEAGEDRYSRVGLPLVVFGSVLYGFLPGLEFAPLAAVETGGDVVATQGVLEPWFVPVFLTAALTFAFGVFAFAKGVAAARVLGGSATRLVVVALAVMGVARAVPVGVVQFHVQALAGLLALVPLAVSMRADQRTVPGSARTSPAT